MVSRQSYLDAFAKFDQDPSKVVWVSDERKVAGITIRKYQK